MKTSIWLALAFASVVGFTATQLQARGGRAHHPAPRAVGDGEQPASNIRPSGNGPQGAVDKKTQRVAWTVGNKGPFVFETSLPNLTQAAGPVSLHFQNGQTRQWNLARLQDPVAAE
ncbi:MAG: hypothetical protein HY288_15495 [Planctomycetia bacterium]|nr:hypothetical protein [Planctomycetia bacterium]